MKQSFPKDIHKTINRVMANHYFDLFNELIGTGKKNKAIQVALEAILNYMNQTQSNILYATTQIMIVPGYRFNIVNVLITNFHQPKSTLLLLLAAFIGEKWRELYEYALNNDYIFLSYGDSSLLIP